jgi:phage terminase large subunit-like protein
MTPSGKALRQMLGVFAEFERSIIRARRAPRAERKLTRFGPFSSQCRAGNVKILRGPWNEDLFRVLEGFPDLAHDDEVDACSGALEMLNPQMKGWAIFELTRRQAEAIEKAESGNRHKDRGLSASNC